MLGVLAKKIGMSHVFNENGALLPVTVLEAGPCFVLQIKSKETDGYNAIQIGFGVKKEKSCRKPNLGQFKKAGVNGALRFIKELRVDDISKYKVGQKIEADVFAKGDYVDAIGISIGKGFQGGMKRWGWAGGDAGHGSMFHRAVGSIQSGARLSRVTKGHHLPGHMGSDRITVQNLEVVQVDKENNLIVVRGCVPGHKNSYLVIREAGKKPKGFVKKKPVVLVTKKKSVKAQTAAAKK